MPPFCTRFVGDDGSPVGDVRARMLVSQSRRDVSRPLCLDGVPSVQPVQPVLQGFDSAQGLTALLNR